MRQRLLLLSLLKGSSECPVLLEQFLDSLLLLEEVAVRQLAVWAERRALPPDAARTRPFSRALRAGQAVSEARRSETGRRGGGDLATAPERTLSLSRMHSRQLVALVPFIRAFPPSTPSVELQRGRFAGGGAPAPLPLAAGAAGPSPAASIAVCGHSAPALEPHEGQRRRSGRQSKVRRRTRSSRCARRPGTLSMAFRRLSRPTQTTPARPCCEGRRVSSPFASFSPTNSLRACVCWFCGCFAVFHARWTQ